ncbi:MAG: DUF1289 domain-containing protein, partial [Gammaproteobacteria bacterium]
SNPRTLAIITTVAPNRVTENMLRDQGQRMLAAELQLDSQSELPPESPCVGLCQLDFHGYCLGCLRTAVEIEMWPEMNATRKHLLLAELDQRRNGPGVGN